MNVCFSQPSVLEARIAVHYIVGSAHFFMLPYITARAWQQLPSNSVSKPEQVNAHLFARLQNRQLSIIAQLGVARQRRILTEEELRVFPKLTCAW